MSPDPPRDELETVALRWAATDPDPLTRSQLRELVDSGATADLAELMVGRIEFGTAGIRSALGPGPQRMNRLVVRQCAAGVARELLQSVGDATVRGVVVGGDSRHGSAQFVSDIVEVVAAHGISVNVFDEPVPTPLVAFAIQYLGAAAGLIVTASHNPAVDNGIKVYWTDGAQIVPPVDGRIAARIDEISRDSLAARRDLSAPDEKSPAGVNHIGGPTSDDPVIVDYLHHAVEAASPVTTPVGRRIPIRIAATALHGVGWSLLNRLLTESGFDDVHGVEDQQNPDPDFPTVAFPNPEEPGALDLLVGLAESIHADLAIANDPDADRLAIAVPDQDGAWIALSGDELGALLTHGLLAGFDDAEHAGENGSPTDEERFVASTVVSSRLAAKIAASHGAEFFETLTGFKWLCRPGLENPRKRQVLLYEEALGYAIGPSARDKDGVAAALVVAEMVTSLRSRGETIWTILDRLAIEHGVHEQLNTSLRFEDADWSRRIDRSMAALTRNPPSELGGLTVARCDLPAPDVFRLYLEDDTRVVVRPSGTEPKVKLYCEAMEPVAQHQDLHDAVAKARATARARLGLISESFWLCFSGLH